MSQHPSLRSSDKDKAQRSVLKRYERIKLLKDKEEWTEKDSVYKLPKVKIIKFKVKKEKVAAADATAEGASPAAPGASPASPGAKAAAGKDAGKSAGGDAKKPAK